MYYAMCYFCSHKSNMGINMLNKIIILTMLLGSTCSFSMENPVFEKLKSDMWELGLSFEYMDGTHIIKPLVDNEQSITGERGATQDITEALNL